MMKQWIAILLVLATLCGVTGCGLATQRDIPAEQTEAPNFIGSSKQLSETAEKPENFLNLAATDENGKAKFKLVYPVNANDNVIAEYKRLTDEIYNATGVSISAGHDLEKTQEYEILIGYGLQRI